MTPLRWQILATQVPAGGSLGGIVRYTTELITALVERDDVVVSAVTTRSAAETLRGLLGGGPVTAVRDAPTPLLSVGERYLPLRSKHDAVDVVHSTKHLVPRTSPALRVLTVHDMLLLDRSQDFGLAKRALLPGPYRASIRDSDVLICVSEATRERMVAHVPESALRARVVHLATSTSLRTSDPQPLAALAGRPFALVVGDPTPRKNLRTVIAAWRRVRHEQPDAVLAIAGPPSWGRTDVGPVFADLVADGAIVELGHVHDAGLRWAYEHAHAVLCPSLAEGFGLPAAEALTFGAPVLISADPALQEVAAGRARAVLPFHDTQRWAQAIVAAFREEPGRRSPCAAGVSRSWADVAVETVDAVREAIAKR